MRRQITNLEAKKIRTLFYSSHKAHWIEVNSHFALKPDVVTGSRGFVVIFDALFVFFAYITVPFNDNVCENLIFQFVMPPKFRKPLSSDKRHRLFHRFRLLRTRDESDVSETFFTCCFRRGIWFSFTASCISWNKCMNRNVLCSLKVVLFY